MLQHLQRGAKRPEIQNLLKELTRRVLSIVTAPWLMSMTAGRRNLLRFVRRIKIPYLLSPNTKKKVQLATFVIVCLNDCFMAPQHCKAIRAIHDYDAKCVKIKAPITTVT
jgi:hypothetical protein